MIDMNKLRAIKEAQTAEEPVAPSSPIRRGLGELAKERAVENFNTDYQRILDMPVEEGITDDEYWMVNNHCIQPTEMDKPDGYRLFRVQAASLLTYARFGGAFLPITVGGGKTLTSLLIANEAYCTGLDRIMLIIPPNLVDQLRDVDLPNYRQKVVFNTPVHFIAGMPAQQRMARSKSNMRGLYVFTYSLLSSKHGADLLDNIEPQLIITDEAHKISSVNKSAMAGRFADFVKRHDPQQVAMSGTMTRNSPMEYYDIARNCLKEHNFLPNIRTVAEAWAMAIGSDADNSDSTSVSVTSKPLLPLIQWARQTFPDEQFDIDLSGFRKAYQTRMYTSPAVIASGQSTLGVGMTIHNDPNPHPENETGYDEMMKLIDQVQLEWITPSGDEIDYGMHLWKWLYEIQGAGFYNELYWPEIDYIAEHRNITYHEAHSLLSRSKEHHEAKQVYNCELRKFIEGSGRKGLDTPMLVGLSMAHYGAKEVGTILYDLWIEMKGKDFAEIIERKSRSVRVCPFKITSAVNYVKSLPKGEGAILWYYSAEVGRWLYEALLTAGFDPLYCPAGPQYNGEIIKPIHKNRPVVASISAHGTGKNLQHFGHMRYVQWPRDAKIAEQSLGRIHRSGQLRKDVVIHTDIATPFDEATMAATLNDAAYIHQTLGTPQRLMTADFIPRPKIVPIQALHEWGLRDVRHTSESVKFLHTQLGK